MEVSIGIMAYNEERNIGNLIKNLLHQKLNFVKEIIVIDDGSTDGTSKIVSKFLKNKKIKLVNLKRRGGKVKAINLFLRMAKSSILIIESADTLPRKNSIRILCECLKNPKIGIVGAHAIPINKIKDFANFFGAFTYRLHHEIALKEPKFGELIAFRNLLKKIPNTAVDEEYIAMLIRKRGYILKYCPNAIFYNKQPDSIKEIISRRSRNVAGHLRLMKKGYVTSTHKFTNIIGALIKNFQLKSIHYIFLAILLEIYIRIVGYCRYYCSKKDNILWKVSESTKSLPIR
ncbi:glycosyltransferase [Candidatus Woesearchaeota archaeon]|nr:glycosyltransferase [Candidatus Woesearchaeota archaeon]